MKDGDNAKLHMVCTASCPGLTYDKPTMAHFYPKVSLHNKIIITVFS